MTKNEKKETTNNEKTFNRIADAYLNPDNFNAQIMKYQLNDKTWIDFHPTFQIFFRDLISSRGIEANEFNELSNNLFPSDDTLYDYLTQIYKFVYENGPEEAIDEAMERAYHQYGV